MVNILRVLHRGLWPVSPGSVDVEAVDVEGEQGDHVRQQREGKGQAEAGRQAPVPQDGLHEGGHQVDVAWAETRASKVSPES